MQSECGVTTAALAAEEAMGALDEVPQPVVVYSLVPLAAA